MLNKIKNILTSIPATIIAGVSLVASFILSQYNITLPIDPAYIAIIICGLPILYSAIRKLIFSKGISKISSALLISSAMIAATVIGDVFAAGEVAFIMAIGEILEDLTTDRAKRGLKNLVNLVPKTARVLKDGIEHLTPIEALENGDIIRILPGEKISADGVILSGETSVDQSVITGESLPCDKGVGDSVFCGTVNCYGAIDIKATGTGKDSSLEKLIQMVKDAEDKKAPMARIADKAASGLVPLALLIAIITGIVTKDITRAVTVLVVFCPCALVLATPTAIMAAIGQATKRGVIIKSGEALEKMGKTNIIAFDKTGTLTKGKLTVCDTVVLNENETEESILTLAAIAESKSEHPLGKSIVEFAKLKNYPLGETTSFEMLAGKGVAAEYQNKIIICGNFKLINEKGISLSSKALDTLEGMQNEGKVAVIVVKDNVAIGIIALADTLKENAADAINRLGLLSAKSVLLTGDNSRTAHYFAKNIGINEIYAELLPENKVEHITQLKEKGNTVCMVGDGVNDAPALKTADVSVAMGSIGSDIAVESADIAIMSDDITAIAYLKKLSLATVKTIIISITLSMLINIVAVVLSVLGLLGPTTGALVHNLGSIFVIMLAALLYDRKFK